MEKYIVVVNGQEAIVSSIEESIAFITSQAGQECDEKILRKLSMIFSGQIHIPEGVVLSKNQYAFFFKAFDETLNIDHNIQEIERKRQIMRKQIALHILKSEKKGIYQVTIHFLRTPEHPGAIKRICAQTSQIFAKSGMDAYNKMSTFLHEKFNDICDALYPESTSMHVNIVYNYNQDLH